MTHVFVLILVIGGNMVSKDMYFYDIERCNYFAKQLTKRYGNYHYRDLIPTEHRVTAYCKPVYVNTEKMEIY